MSLRAVVLGAGLMGRWHAHAIRQAGASLIGVVDPDQDAAATLGPATTMESAMAASPDVVHVCSPVEQHDEDVERALTSGAHVIAEKPVAPTAARTAALLDLAADRGLTLTPVHQMPLQRWRGQVPEVGPLVAIEHTLHSAGPGDPDAIAASIVCHPLSVMVELLGPEAVAGAHWAIARGAPGELRGLATGGGVALQFAISMSARPPCNELVVAGQTATLHADLFHGFGTVDRVSAGRAGKLARPFARAAATLGQAGSNLGRRALAGEAAFPGLDVLIARVYAAIAAEGPSPLSPAHTLAVARARDAILAAGAP